MATILFGDARYHATRAGDAQTAGIALMNMAQVFVEDDDLDMAARVADEAGDLLRASGTPSRRAESLEIRGEIALLRHDWDTAIELLELAREIAQHYGYLPSFHETSALLAEAYLFAGRPHEARAAACEVVTDSIGPGRGAAQALAVVARMACEEGDERGFTTAGVALAMVDHLGDETTRRSVSRILDGVIDRTRPRVAERESDGRRLPWSAVVDLVCGPSPLTSQ
ncbi:MAG: tetratricopeptide repeat protein [Acidimicrobiia bacterium]